MNTAHTYELYWGAGLFVGVVVIAALVNLVNPKHRVQRRRLVTLLVFYLIALVLGFVFEATDLPKWSNGCFLGAQFIQAFLLVNLGATLAFSVIVPAVGLELPMIATDLLVGVGYIVSTLGILSMHGLDPTGALVSGAVVSAVLAISLQQTLGNILGGIALQLDGSIHEGDWIQLENGKQGRVRAVRWRHTVVETRDWSTIIVPNAQLLATNITILGKRDGSAGPQRMWVWFNVDFRYPPSKVIAVVDEAVNAAPIDNVAVEPRPSVVCMDFSRDGRESYATYAVRYWLIDIAADDPTSSRVRSRIYTALARADIPLAMPAVTNFVEVHDEDRARKRIAREHEEHLAALKTVGLFRALTDDELRTLAAGMSHVIYTSGEKITRQGAIAHWLYVMTQGTADIRASVENGEHFTVAKIKAPDFFGEMGLITGEKRSADVVATSDVECFRLGKATFEKVLLARPEIANELSEKLATRRVELIAMREGLDASTMGDRHDSERERILGGIKSFFGL